MKSKLGILRIMKGCARFLGHLRETLFTKSIAVSKVNMSSASRTRNFLVQRKPNLRKH